MVGSCTSVNAPAKPLKKMMGFVRHRAYVTRAKIEEMRPAFRSIRDSSSRCSMALDEKGDATSGKARHHLHSQQRDPNNHHRQWLRHNSVGPLCSAPCCTFQNLPSIRVPIKSDYIMPLMSRWLREV